MWSVSVPTYLEFGKRKIRKVPLNLNQYRNASHFLLNDMKIKFAEIVAPRIVHVPSIQKVRLSYWLYVPSQRELDINNVVCIVDKFFQDVLVAEGKIPDDNFKHVLGTASGFGGFDKSNPRVDILIEDMSNT